MRRSHRAQSVAAYARPRNMVAAVAKGGEEVRLPRQEQVVEGAVAGDVGVPAGQHRDPALRARTVLRVRLREAHPSRRERVDVRSASDRVPERADGVGALLIAHEEQQVRTAHRPGLLDVLTAPTQPATPVPLDTTFDAPRWPGPRARTTLSRNAGQDARSVPAF